MVLKGALMEVLDLARAMSVNKRIKKRWGLMGRDVPNCRQCTWRNAHEYRESGTHIIRERVQECSAQGYILCSQVYNTRQCKKLFEWNPRADQR